MYTCCWPENFQCTNATIVEVGGVLPQKPKILRPMCPIFNLNRSISSETILKHSFKCKIPYLSFNRNRLNNIFDYFYDH